MKAKLSPNTFNALFNKYLVLQTVFSEYEDDASLGEVNWEIVPNKAVISELVKIAKSEDTALKLRWKYIGQDLQVGMYWPKKKMSVTLAFDPRPFTDSDDADADCLGDYDINIKTHIADFSYRLEH
jgi:hypothetical protein